MPFEYLILSSIIIKQVMTTFQRFQRNTRSQVNSHVRNSGHIESDYTQTRIKQLVSFSQKALLFRINHNSMVSCKASVRMNNLSGFRIHFKVKCNNPSKYNVIPYQQILLDRGQITIVFERQNDQDLKRSISSNKQIRDKFEIVWGKLSNVPGQVNILSESKILPVIFQTNFSENVNYRAYDFMETKKGQKQPVDFQQLQSTQKFASPHKNKLNNPEQETLLRKNILIGVSVISFILGYILT